MQWLVLRQAQPSHGCPRLIYQQGMQTPACLRESHQRATYGYDREVLEHTLQRNLLCMGSECPCWPVTTGKSSCKCHIRSKPLPYGRRCPSLMYSITFSFTSCGRLSPWTWAILVSRMHYRKKTCWWKPGGFHSHGCNLLTPTKMCCRPSIPRWQDALSAG